MRILVAHNVDRRRTGGMSRIMELIHDEVAAEGHVVDWLTAEDVPPRWRGSRARIAFPLLVWQRARDEARKGRPYDLVNVHEPHSMPVAMAQANVAKVGVVITSHGLERRAWDLALEEGRLGRGGPSLRSRILYPATSLWQSRVGLSRARFVFTLNEEDKSYLTARCGVPAERVGRMRPGAAAIFAAPATRRTYGRGDRLLFFGSWRQNKGTADLVAAFEELAQRQKRLTLTVLGAGVEPSIVRNSFSASVRDRVVVIPFTDDANAVGVLSDADIFVLPSLFEGTPLVLIEAMMSGLPIVTTDTCGMRDVVEHERTGLLVPVRSPARLAQAIERLISEPNLRAALGRGAHEYARQYHTWKRVGQEVLSTYERLAREGQIAACHPADSRSAVRC